jgi:hypothetical protein
MRLIVVPRDRLLALERGASGFLHALLTLEQDPDPRFSVVRSFNGGRFTWHIQVGPHLLPLDSRNIEAMAAAVPIYLVDLVHELQDELSEVMLKPGMMEGVERLIPFIRTLKNDEPS